jgi:REP element-mobilizing transposase RayT
MSNGVGARASRPHRGWHERGYLPHFDAGAVVQTVTFRLADSLPREFYEKAAAIAANNIERAVLLERGIDQGRGDCILSDPINAEIVRGTLQHFDGDRYRLLAWVIMPNHVHAMIEQMEGHPLAGILYSWKSYSAHAINKARSSSRRVWSADYFDRYVRNEDHYAHVKYYIEHNPVKARLVKEPKDWPYSSASSRA